jgi:hypothetical protein
VRIDRDPRLFDRRSGRLDGGVVLFDHDEVDPWTKLMSCIFGGRRVTPWQVGLIELDEGEVPELGVVLVRFRPSSHHDPRVEPDDVAGAYERQTTGPNGRQ